MEQTTNLCVITERMSEKELIDFKLFLEKHIGVMAREGLTIDDKTDLFFEIAQVGIESIVDELNNMDEVSLAHYLDDNGHIYPRI